jgi:hypothetical protein
MDYNKLIFKYTDEYREENYEKFLSVIKDDITGERKDQLLEFYTSDPWVERVKTAPASSVAYFHLACVGGYCEHILNVVKACKGAVKFFESMGGTIDFEMEELIFAALHHDLGKLGDESGPYYIPNESDWHIKNQQMFFKTNPQLQNMSPSDRGLFLLQDRGIKVSLKETFGIKLADGLYEECNKEYLMQFSAAKQMKTELPYLLHMADYISARAESNQDKLALAAESKDMKKLFG